ncbi:MAG: PAS domain-containing sensor histidine kinase [Oscillospiraceae bacterium]|nr:PAS domain-containing sensor histidine kinase [Oscillospiraceae bacterium]
MQQSPSDILALTGEAAVLIRRGRVSFANAAARRLLGEDCVGKTVLALFGADVAGAQASSFVANVPLAGRSCILRVNRTEDGQILFLSDPDAAPAIINDPLLYELRNGLMNVGMAADALRAEAERLGNDTLLTALCSLTRSYYRLQRLATSASLLLTAGQNALPMRAAPFDLSELCRSTVELAQHFAPGFRYGTELESPVPLCADPVLVRYLLLNLLANCMTHAGDGCGITVSLTASQSSAVLSVSDDGRGIEPEELHTVFDRYRYGFHVTELNRGPGFGLAVCRIITMAHGGTLLLESRPGRGTTVRASLSRTTPPSPELHAPQREKDSPVLEVLQGLSGCLPASCYTERYMD